MTKYQAEVLAQVAAAPGAFVPQGSHQWRACETLRDAGVIESRYFEAKCYLYSYTGFVIRKAD